MKIGHLMTIAGVGRDRYTSLLRHGHLAFLERGIAEPDNVNRFDERHAVALTIMSYLRRLGVAPKEACDAICDGWKDITAISRGELATHNWCGVRINEFRVFDSIGRPNRGTVPGQAIAMAMVDINLVFAECRKAIEDLGLER